MTESGVAPEVDSATAELIARWADEQLTERMGIKITEWDPQRMVGTMPVTGNRQPFGLLHGGASAVLAETLGSMAAWLWVRAGKVPLGVELSCSHHRAATEGDITGVCTPLHRGRTLATFEIRISDEQDRAICTARLTCLFREHLPR
ncbi:MAG TPA: hotdog fold thioesterase [Pseudonocardiaceae bacterium]|nr:hotdog fold thioesterase [Pseudonocardiaceae bacterium]